MTHEPTRLGIVEHGSAMSQAHLARAVAPATHFCTPGSGSSVCPILTLTSKPEEVRELEVLAKFVRYGTTFATKDIRRTLAPAVRTIVRSRGVLTRDCGRTTRGL